MSSSPPERELLGDDERERHAAALGRHFVAGRLDAEALDARVGALYGAAYRDEAEQALSGLPALPAEGPAASRPPRWWHRRGRHGERERAEPGWRPTPERFVDPTTGRVLRVWIDPQAGGSRHYVADG